MHEHHELVLSEDHRAEAWLCRLKRQYAEIETALRDFGANLPRRNTADVDVHQRMRLAEPRDQRKHRVHRCFVAADEHAPAAEIAQVAHRMLRLFRQPQQTIGVVAKQAPRIGERGVLGRAIEQALADAFLEPAHRLTHGRLRSVQLHGCT
jgi:hypothetical protein